MSLSPRKAYEASNPRGPYSCFVCRRKPAGESGGAFVCAVCWVMEDEPALPTKAAWRARYLRVYRALLRAFNASGQATSIEELAVAAKLRREPIGGET